MEVGNFTCATGRNAVDDRSREKRVCEVSMTGKQLSDNFQRSVGQALGETTVSDPAGEWAKFDGYHETHQFIAPNGKIMAEVIGSHFQSKDGWVAYDCRVRPQMWLGRFRSAQEARKCCEEHVSAGEERS